MINEDTTPDTPIPTYNPIMAFWPDEHTILFGDKACHVCGHAAEHYGIQIGHQVRFGSKMCVKCKGTGKRANGQCRECNPRNGYRSGEYKVGRVRDLGQPIDAGPCDSCDATGREKATVYDYMPRDVAAEIMATMPIRVVQAGRDLTHGETLLGVLRDGSITGDYHVIYTCADYGTAAERMAVGHDHLIIARVRESLTREATQAINLARPDSRVCDAITVAVSRNGYTVLAWWDPEK